jgi:hypothetical protein
MTDPNQPADESNDLSHELDPLDFSELEGPKAGSGYSGAAKLSQDDPSLRIVPPPNRQLRKRAFAIAGAIFAAVIGVSFVAAAGSRKAVRTKEDSDEAFNKPVIPQALLDIPEHAPPRLKADKSLLG